MSDLRDAHRNVAGGRNVLIVDDSEPTARALAKLLTAAQFKTAVSYRGDDALRLAQAFPVDAAVIDIHLPDMSGLVVSQSLRQQFGPETPIFIVSGDTSMPTLNSLSTVGATYFFSKPVNSSRLVKQLQECLGDGSSQAE